MWDMIHFTMQQSLVGDSVSQPGLEVLEIQLLPGLARTVFLCETHWKCAMKNNDQVQCHAEGSNRMMGECVSEASQTSWRGLYLNGGGSGKEEAAKRKETL